MYEATKTDIGSQLTRIPTDMVVELHAFVPTHGIELSVNCFFVAFLVYAVAHSMVCAVSKQHRLFHCFIIYQEIAQLTLG